MRLIPILIILSVILAGCEAEVEPAQEPQPEVEPIQEEQAEVEITPIQERPIEEIAIEKCIELCLSQKDNLDQGPCLSNEIVEDWVCDVAHSPRLSLDNQPENQCSAYKEKKAHHFVEVDPECGFIKFY